MRVILVEDDPSTLALLEKNIAKWGHEVTTAANGVEALEAVRNDNFDIIVSDWIMPEMNGLELCEAVRKLDLPHYVYIVLISAQDTRMDVVRGLEGGVDDYIVKPLNMNELRARLEIGGRIIALERELNQKYLAIKRNFYQTVRLFVRFLETYDRNLGGHSRRVGRVSLELAERTPSVSPEDYPIIETAGFLHDIGLIGLPRSVMTKSVVEHNGEEKTLYQSHPQRGAEVLRQVDLLGPVARIVGMHHEQEDGLGFPEGIPGKQMPTGAKIVSAASIYDDLLYRQKIPRVEIPERLQMMRGYQLDGSLVDMLLEHNIAEMEAEAAQNERAVRLDDLKEGMRLSRNVIMKTGASVLPADTLIDASSIEKLKRYQALNNISGKVFIYK